MERERWGSSRHERKEKEWGETAWWDESRFCFALCYTLFTQDLLIFDMCLALFSASPSSASPSLWQLESGRALGVDTHSDNKTQRWEKYKKKSFQVCGVHTGRSHKVFCYKVSTHTEKASLWRVPLMRRCPTMDKMRMMDVEEVLMIWYVTFLHWNVWKRLNLSNRFCLVVYNVNNVQTKRNQLVFWRKRCIWTGSLGWGSKHDSCGFGLASTKWSKM